MATYYVPDQYVGKSLNQIQKEGGQLGRADVLGSYLNIDPNSQFTQGQSFNIGNIPGVNPSGSAELQFVNKSFTPASVYQKQQQAQLDAQNQKRRQQEESKLLGMLNQGKEEAIGTIESGKGDLKSRYDEIISSIKGTADQRVGQAETATSREFGKRGIPLTSGVYDTALQNARLPIDTALNESLANVGLQEEQANQARDMAIANIQNATSREGVQAALQLYQIAENARQQGISLAESQRQFDEQLALSREQLGESQYQFRNPQTSASSLADNYLTLGEGSTLFDLLSGQALYTAPKTYKPTGGGGGSFDEGNWG